ncbi:receptor-like protein 12 [Durio zibethinus]|uniref:Receptor-like protein 12 n=1 Tax=Durio zibethinus TaxID=66656 RepID=A0A6P5WQ00_DURZI|nr:receptor-like protein 12 [Durio zibethinus]
MEFLVDRATEEYEPMRLEFPYEDLITICQLEKEEHGEKCWRMYFDGAIDALGQGIRPMVTVIKAYMKKFEGVKLSCVSRTANRAADCIAVQARHGMSFSSWDNAPPLTGFCDPSFFGVIVTRLYFDDNNFKGFIPSTLGNLSKLKTLSLHNNNLKGPIPAAVGNLSNLKWNVDFRTNNFITGHLSSGIFDHLPKLRALSLTWNQISGRIPNSLFKCKELVYLSLHNNSLEGSLPIEIGNLTMLNKLSLYGNNLKVNTIEDDASANLWHKRLAHMIEKELQVLARQSLIPLTKGNLDQLQVLVLRSNRFYGLDNSKVTSSFTHLRVIDLSHNHFSGYLPMKFFENLHAIREGYEKKVKPEYMIDASADGIAYYIQSVSFTAKGLETEFQEMLTTWTVIDFSSNQFMGEIPKALGELHSLVVLNLSHNSLTGPIPSSLAICQSLNHWISHRISKKEKFQYS